MTTKPSEPKCEACEWYGHLCLPCREKWKASLKPDSAHELLEAKDKEIESLRSTIVSLSSANAQKSTTIGRLQDQVSSLLKQIYEMGNK